LKFREEEKMAFEKRTEALGQNYTAKIVEDKKYEF